MNVKGGYAFHMIRFDFINVILKFCLMFEF